MRAWQLVPGTPGFVVDRFCNLPQQVRGREDADIQASPAQASPASPAAILQLSAAGVIPQCVSSDPSLPACLQSPYRHWFLTHFHADHYKGLTGK